MAEPGTGDTGDGNGNGANAFFDSIADEDLRGNEHLQPYGETGLDGLAKDFVDMKGSLPVVPEDYTYEFPEEMKPTDEMLAPFKEMAKAGGYTQAQYEMAVKYDLDRATQYQEAQEKAAEAQAEEYEGLKAKLGDKHTAVVERGKKILEAADLKDLGDEIDSSPELLKLMSWVFDKISESSLETGGTSSGNDGDKRERTEEGNPQLEFPSMKEK